MSRFVISAPNLGLELREKIEWSRSLLKTRFRHAVGATRQVVVDLQIERVIEAKSAAIGGTYDSTRLGKKQSAERISKNYNQK